MSDRFRSGLSRALILALTVGGVWGILSFGTESTSAPLEIGVPSPQRFVAPTEINDIVDVERTEEARKAEADKVPDQFAKSTEKTDAVMAGITSFFERVKVNAVIPDAVTAVEIPDPFGQVETTEPADSQSTSTSAAPAETTLSGSLYLDLDGDGLFSLDAGDVSLPNVDIAISNAAGLITTVRTNAEGAIVGEPIISDGPIQVKVVTSDADFPDDFALSTGNNPQVIEEVTSSAISFAPIGFTPSVRSLELQQGLLADQFRFFTYESTIPTLASLATKDVVRAARGLPSLLDEVKIVTLGSARERLADGIADDPQVLDAVKRRVYDSPPFVVLDNEIDNTAADAAADVIAFNLIPTLDVDEQATARAREAAAATVSDIVVDFKPGETIVAEGEVVTAVQYEAITVSDLNRPTATQYVALLAIVSVLVLVVMFYIARFRPAFWSSTRRVALFGTLVVLAAGSVRAVPAIGAVNGFEGLSGYAVPAAGFGFIVAILFDARLAVLTAIAVSAITGISTGDPGYAVYALLSAIGPVPFVSAISTRADFRRALGYASVLAALIAAAGAWYFHAPLLDLPVEDTVLRATLLAFVVSLLSTLVAGMALSFFEVAFDITTALRLLDVTDRNHPALQLLQEEAWGTFNHSLMVGTLADAAARSIGANNLLALAAAYYHDLGKTENPAYFIENQFGVGNPHDLISPEESAKVVRQHVVDGIELAKKYKIPSEVAEGIVCHHGDGIMQYFYQQALEARGEDRVNVSDYRHIGHKPKTREMAILMMADALEGASRAIFSEQDPSPEKITGVVERIVGEKLSDGQLSESDLTLGELSVVKGAFAEALLGHYHQRIPYPNFPGSGSLARGPAEVLSATFDDDGAILDLPSIESDPATQPPSDPDVIPMRRQKER